MLKWLQKKLGYRWSLLLLENKSVQIAHFHAHNAGDLVGYINGALSRNGDPEEPYSFCLNFNHDHSTIHLTAKDFDDDGRSLMRRIEEIDPEAYSGRHLAPDEFGWIQSGTNSTKFNIYSILWK